MNIPKKILDHININIQKTPFYIYDKNTISKNCDDFLNIPYKNKSIHFASMANSNPELLSFIKNKGMNIFVNSILHLKLALKLGFRKHEIIFTASAMNDETMKIVRKHDILLNLDSINQINKWQKLFPKVKFGIRVNLSGLIEAKKTTGGYFIGKKSRLGLIPEEIEQIAGNKNINMLHLYAGTDILDMEYFFSCYKQFVKFAKYFPNLEYLNFGGGFPISNQNNKFDFEQYGKKLAKLLDNISVKKGRKIKLLLEPGRVIAGNSGFFVCKVVDIKQRANHQFVGVDASSVQFPRPLFYPETAEHQVVTIVSEHKNKQDTKIKSSIYGCSTYSRDFLAKNILLQNLSIDDIIIFHNAGSYFATAHTQFLGFEKPKEIFI